MTLPIPKSQIRWLAFALAVTALGGCATDNALSKKPKPTYLQAVADLGLRGLYPPRHNVQVGDVFIAYDDGSPYDRTEYYLGNVDAYFSASTDRAASIDCHPENIGPDCGLADDFAQVYTGRATIVKKDDEETAASFSKSTIAPGWLGLTGLLDARTAIPWEKLDRVAFPSIRIKTGLEADAQLSGNVSSIWAALGLGQKRDEEMTLNFPDVRTLGVPIQEGKQSITAFCNVNRENGNDICGPEFVESTLKLAKGGNIECSDDEDRCYLFIITRVFVADNILYSSTDLGADALGLGIGLDGPPAAAIAGATLPTDVAAAATTAAAGAQPDTQPLTTIEAPASETAVELGTGAKGSFTLKRYGGRGTLLSQSFEKPVTIAFDGMAIQPF